MDKYKIKFNEEEAKEEILLYSYNLYDFVDDNRTFFNNLWYQTMEITHNNSKIKKSLISVPEKILTISVFYLILKSMYHRQFVGPNDSFKSQSAMLSREQVEFNLIKYAFPLCEIYELNIKTVKRELIRIIIGLTLQNSVEKLILLKLNCSNQRNNIRSQVFIRFNIKHSCSFSRRVSCDFMLSYPQYFDHFSIGSSIATLNKNFKPNRYNNIITPLNKEKLDILKNASKIPLKIDKIGWDFIKNKTILPTIQLDCGRILNPSDLSKSVDLLEVCIKERESSADKLLSDALEIKKSVDLDITLKNEKVKHLFSLYYSELDKVKFLKTKLQKLSGLVAVENFVKENRPVYLTYFFDFRYRIYSNSKIHPMFVSEIRNVILIDSLVSEKNILNSNYFKIVKKYFSVLKYNESDLVDLGIDIKNISDLDKYFLLVLFLEIGKENKLQLNQVSSINLGVNFEDFVNYGIKTALRYKYNPPVVDNYYIIKCLRVIENFVKTQIWLNITLIRDATASTMQFWALLLSLKKKEYMKWFNLRGDTWYDTYTIILNLFIEHLEEKDPKLLKTFTRENLKQVIMTSNYNVSQWRSKNYFIDNIKKYISVNNIKLSNSEFKKLLNLHKSFYVFLKNDLFNILFKNEKNFFIDQILNDSEIESYDRNYKCFIYYKYKKVIENTIYNGCRWRKTYKYLLSEIDINKTLTSAPANIIQHEDARFAHHLIKNTKCFAIHDSFIFSMFDTHEIMDQANYYLNNSNDTLNNYATFCII